MGSRRFLGTTKGRIVVSLCRRRHTVAELAAELGLTDNAVRAQLQRLQRDGLARPAGSRRGVRKPHVDYELTGKARELFPRAYEPVLQKLIDVLTEFLTRKEAREVLCRTARGLVSEQVGRIGGSTPRQRLSGVLERLNGAGLGIELTEDGDKTTVRSCACPVASVTAAHPELCGAFASVLGEVLNGEVRERCERGESPRCCFDVAMKKRGRARGNDI